MSKQEVGRIAVCWHLCPKAAVMFGTLPVYRGDGGVLAFSDRMLPLGCELAEIARRRDGSWVFPGLLSVTIGPHTSHR